MVKLSPQILASEKKPLYQNDTGQILIRVIKDLNDRLVQAYKV